MKKWLNVNYLYLLGVLAGGLLGYLYWNFVGCLSGTCMITSDPFNSTLYGALMGGLLIGMFSSDKSRSSVS